MTRAPDAEVGLKVHKAGLVPPFVKVPVPVPETIDQLTLPYVPPAAEPDSVIELVPLHEFIVPPAEAVGGVFHLTVLVLVTVPVQGETPVTVNVAVNEPFGLPPLGVNA